MLDKSSVEVKMSSADDDDALALAAFCIVAKKKATRKNRREWCKEWVMKRNTYSHVNLLAELKIYPRDWHNYLRMNEATYLHLLSLVTPLIAPQQAVQSKLYGCQMLYIFRKYMS